MAWFGLPLDAQTPAGKASQAKEPGGGLEFTLGEIPPVSIACEGHVSTTKNGVKFDVFFDNGRKSNAVIYAINTGRKQLVLTPDKHKAILEDLIRRKFTVIVADFRDKKLPGIELEKYTVRLTEDARAAADGILHPSALLRPPLATKDAAAVSKTDTFANDYFTLMPGFTVRRDVAWFHYSDIPEPLRKEIATQLGKPFSAADGGKANTYDLIYPAHGPAVGVLTHYCSSENEREDYYPTEKTYLVMAFAFKNLAVIHQQYFNDPVGGYPKGYGYYGDQFAASFIRHVKGNAASYHIDPRKICAFGHSKGSEVPGMLVNRLRGTPPYFDAKVNFKKVNLMEKDRTIPSPFSGLPTDITCAIFGAGIANQEMHNDKAQPWNNHPATNLSPFFIYADHRADTRLNTRKVVAKAEANGVPVETVEQESHTWPIGSAYDKASAFTDRMLDLHY
ncbi:MAG: hypothetical protein EBS05_24230 [Proteobacteria bacterium]|nr:hypothetical protein [Pseudomonadota bacterium]